MYSSPEEADAYLILYDAISTTGYIDPIAVSLCVCGLPKRIGAS